MALPWSHDGVHAQSPWGGAGRCSWLVISPADDQDASQQQHARTASLECWKMPEQVGQQVDPEVGTPGRPEDLDNVDAGKRLHDSAALPMTSQQPAAEMSTVEKYVVDPGIDSQSSSPNHTGRPTLDDVPQQQLDPSYSPRRLTNSFQTEDLPSAVNLKPVTEPRAILEPDNEEGPDSSGVSLETASRVPPSDCCTPPGRRRPALVLYSGNVRQTAAMSPRSSQHGQPDGMEVDLISRSQHPEHYRQHDYGKELSQIPGADPKPETTTPDPQNHGTQSSDHEADQPLSPPTMESPAESVKPTPAGRRRRRGISSAGDTRFVQENLEPERTFRSSVEVPQVNPSILQKSASQTTGRFFRAAGPALLQKLQATSAFLGRSFSRGNGRERLARNASGKNDDESLEGICFSGSAAGHPMAATVPTTDKSVRLAPQSHDPTELLDDDAPKPGRLSRLFRFGGWESTIRKESSTESSKFSQKMSVWKKVRIVTTSGPKDGIDNKVEYHRVETECKEVHDLTQKLDPESTTDQDVFASPRTSVSSVSTLHSDATGAKAEPGRETASYRKKLKSEILKSQRWLLRLHRKLQWRSKDQPGDGVVDDVVDEEFYDCAPENEHEKVIHGSARFAFEKLSIAKLVARHKRNSTWDAGGNRASPTRNPFTPKQPRLASRDAQGLLTPPRKLSAGDNASTEMQNREKRKGKLSMLDLQPRSFTSTITEVSQKRSSSIDLGSEPPPPMAEYPATVHAAASVPTRLQTFDMDAPNLENFQVSQFRVNPLTSDECEDPEHDQLSLAAAADSSCESVGDVEINDQGDSPLTTGSQIPLPTKEAPRSRRRDGNDCSLAENDAPTWSSTTPSDQAVFVKHTVCEETQHADPTKVRQVFAAASDAMSIDVTELFNERRRMSTESASRSDMSLKKGASRPLPLPVSPRLQPLPSFEEIVAGRGPTDNTLLKFFFKCREIESLNKFLGLQKKRLLESSVSDFENCFHIILSGANSGVSSMVASMCTTWLLENTLASAASTNWHAIPVMNMTRKQLWQHRDAAWLFHVCGIDAAAMLFLDEISSLNETFVAGRVKRAVIGQDLLVTMNEVGSSCTLLAEKFQQEAPALLQARYMKTLLLAGILLDTENLVFGSSRDKEAATSLLVGAGSLGRNGFFNHLKQIRDEKYVTSFITEIYPRPVGEARGGAQSEPGSADPQRECKSEPPAAVLAGEVMGSSPPPPSPKTPDRASSPQSNAKGEHGSRVPKIPLALRRLRTWSNAP